MIFSKSCPYAPETFIGKVELISSMYVKFYRKRKSEKIIVQRLVFPVIKEQSVVKDKTWQYTNPYLFFLFIIDISNGSIKILIAVEIIEDIAIIELFTLLFISQKNIVLFIFKSRPCFYFQKRIIFISSSDIGTRLYFVASYIV